MLDLSVAPTDALAMFLSSCAINLHFKANVEMK